MADGDCSAFKTCSKCGASKPTTEFDKKSASKGGHRPRCKPCRIVDRRDCSLRNTEAEEARSRGMKRFFTGIPCRNGHLAQRYVRPDHDCVVCALDRRRRYVPSETVLAKAVADMAAWRANNIDRAKATTRMVNASRHARKLNATPSWADRDAINAIYQWASAAEIETGIKHEVDHIVPLKGRLVCGLHVEGNLRVVTRDVNRKKGNRHVVY